MGKKRIWFPLGRIDFVLIGTAMAMFAIGVLLVWLFPPWFVYYLSLLDVRYWPPWKCIGLAVVLVESVVVIRRWPDRKRRVPARTAPHE